MSSEPPPKPRDLPEIAEALEAVGMSPEEGRVYLYLLQAGPSKVGQLAPYFEASRSKLYRLLDDLARKGFVTKTPERPTVYHPVFPRDAFEIGREELERRHEHLESVEDELLATLDRLHRPAGGPDPPAWNKIEGSERIYEVVRRLIGEADQSLWVARTQESTPSPWLPVVRETWSTAKQAVRDEDVEARFLLGHAEADEDSLPGWIMEGYDRVRAIDAENPVHFTVVDEEALVFWVETAPVRERGGRENVAVHTTADGPVKTHVALFERLWQEASPLGDSGGGRQGQG